MKSRKTIVYCLSLQLTLAVLAGGCASSSFELPDAGMDASIDSGADSGQDIGHYLDPEATLASTASAELYENDLLAISIPRPTGSEGHKTVKEFCAGRLEELGYKVELMNYGTGVNVIGVKKGESPDQVIISAHYDGVEGCPAADDNASGTAGVLEAARLLAQASFKNTLVVALWDEEEMGGIGSKAYALRASQNRDRIIISTTLDMIGYMSSEENSQKIPTGLDLLFPDEAQWLARHKYKADFIVYCMDDLGHQMSVDIKYYSKIFGLPSITMELTQDQKNAQILSDLRRGDHASFWDFDYPSMIVNDSNEFRFDGYHCKNGKIDSPDVVNAPFAVKVVQATVAASAKQLEIR